MAHSDIVAENPVAGSVPTISAEVSTGLLARIRSENLNVYRASAQRLREDVGQESQIAQDYRGRLIYELLQNADDAMSSLASQSATIAFILDGNDLWVANSGRPLDEADVRGLCGISASSKGQHGVRRASIGHKGMGFKSVLEITAAPEIYSTTIAFRFGPQEAAHAVKQLVDEGIIDAVKRAPVTRFPWPIDAEPEVWRKLRIRGMRTAFRFPLSEKMTSSQRNGLANALRELPVTSLVFLKHLGRVEVEIHTSEIDHFSAWTVAREQVGIAGSQAVSEFSDRGTYRVVITSDDGKSDTFLLAHEPDIPIGEHRGGLGEVAWEGVSVTEVSVAARLRDGQPAALEPHWRKLHVFLPTAESCPYDLLISGAFNSNLSRQEIRVETDASNYNRFLLKQVAQALRDTLIPGLLSDGAFMASVIRLLDRRCAVGANCTTTAAQTLYEEVRTALIKFPLVPSEIDGPLQVQSCALPPLAVDPEFGPAFRRLLPARAELNEWLFPTAEFCGGDIGRILVDHGAYCLTLEEVAQILTRADPVRSRLEISGQVLVDPVLRVLEMLWSGLGDVASRNLLSIAVRREPLLPIALAKDDTAQRVATAGLSCFYPPRSLQGSVPLDGLCFLMQEICWGDFTPKERRQQLQQQLRAWQELFDIQEFKFPEVMRASVLPALDLERDAEARHEREGLRSVEKLAAICQLAGRTSNPRAPLPYERLGANRALFNLSRLDVPCRTKGETVEWVPAYRVYFGEDWVGENSVEWILRAAQEIDGAGLPEIHFLAPPTAFSGLLEKYSHLRAVIQGDAGDVGIDEVAIDEDEESALEEDERSRWLAFFQWLGVNQVLRPVHFHDVEDRASGWLKTINLARPEGWIFNRIHDGVWRTYRDDVLKSLPQATDHEVTVPYFYRLHDLEHLVEFLRRASQDSSAKLGRALYEHLARNWAILEPFSQVQVAQVLSGQVPAMRTKPPRAKPEELVEVGPDFWVVRLQQYSFCPTGHGPRRAQQVWLPTQEVERRFGRRAKAGSFLVPALDVAPTVLKGKAKGFAQAIGVRDDLTPANFSLEDARLLLQRLRDLYAARFESGEDLRIELREVLRPAYRNLFELLSGRERHSETNEHSLADAPLLAFDGASKYRFLDAGQIFYADRRDTRERIKSADLIWTFVIDALPSAKASMTRDFGVRVLEESLSWSPQPADPAIDGDDLDSFRSGLQGLAPYILARIAADRSDERLGRSDARQLRRLFECLEPVTALELACQLDGRLLDLGHYTRDSFVQLDASGDPVRSFVVWGEYPWPPTVDDAEALAGALCDVFGPGYFEPFLALVQATTTEMRERILRRAGAPLDIEERRASFATADITPDNASTQTEQEDPKTAPKSAPAEESAVFPTDGNKQVNQEAIQHVPLHDPAQLMVDGQPVLIQGTKGNLIKGGVKGATSSPIKGAVNGREGGFGGRTNLDHLNEVGMSVALAFERSRMRRSGLLNAEVFDPMLDGPQPDALVFDVSTPDRIARALAVSLDFKCALTRLETEFGVSADWPGFDILTLDSRLPELFDRLIELKSSGVASRVQEMTWNEWKTAGSNTLRNHFYLYLVGNLRSDLGSSVPFIRTIRNPFEQLNAEVHLNHSVSRRVQLMVHQFQQAEHLNLSVRAPEAPDGTDHNENHAIA